MEPTRLGAAAGLAKRTQNNKSADAGATAWEPSPQPACACTRNALPALQTLTTAICAQFASKVGHFVRLVDGPGQHTSSTNLPKHHTHRPRRPRLNARHACVCACVCACFVLTHAMREIPLALRRSTLGLEAARTNNKTSALFNSPSAHLCAPRVARSACEKHSSTCPH